MRRFTSPLLVASALVLAACVTINVYFPAAEAQEAAAEFVEKVIGDDPAQPAPPANPPQSSRQPRFNLMSLVISDAQAQEVDITINTPAIKTIQERMAARFKPSFEAHFNSGALGFSNDGLIVVRDASKVALKDRVAITQLVAEDNRDRKAVYREIAVANGHAEWEGQIRETFARQWVASAHKGWWYQSSDDAWKQK